MEQNPVWDSETEWDSETAWDSETEWNTETEGDPETECGTGAVGAEKKAVNQPAKWGEGIVEELSERLKKIKQGGNWWNDRQSGEEETVMAEGDKQKMTKRGEWNTGIMGKQEEWNTGTVRKQEEWNTGTVGKQWEWTPGTVGKQGAWTAGTVGKQGGQNTGAIGKQGGWTTGTVGKQGGQNTGAIGKQGGWTTGTVGKQEEWNTGTVGKQGQWKTGTVGKQGGHNTETVGKREEINTGTVTKGGKLSIASDENRIKIYSEPTKQHKKEQVAITESPRQSVRSVKSGLVSERVVELQSGLVSQKVAELSSGKGVRSAEPVLEPTIQSSEIMGATRTVAELAQQWGTDEETESDLLQRVPPEEFTYHKPESESTQDPQRKLLICYWDTQTDISWLATLLSLYSSFEKIGLTLSLATEEELKNKIRSSTQIIFFQSKNSSKSIEDVQSFLEHCIDINSERRVPEVWQQKHYSKYLHVGIFSRSKDRGLLLQTLLSKKNMKDMLMEFRQIDISRTTEEEIREAISKCSYSILHFSKKNIYDIHFLSLFEMKKVLVIIDDLEDETLQKMLLVQQEQSVTVKEIELDLTMKESLNARNKNLNPYPPYNIGIFSRSAESDYKWLQTLLRSEGFRGHVLDMQSFYISNNGFQQFREDVNWCTVGILYHTRNRGGINLTDVVSSLYDNELDYLSQRLGRDNVLVVIDDLEDSGFEEKDRILKNQPTIGRCSVPLLSLAPLQRASHRASHRVSHRTSHRVSHVRERPIECPIELPIERPIECPIECPMLTRSLTRSTGRKPEVTRASYQKALNKTTGEAHAAGRQYTYLDRFDLFYWECPPGVQNSRGWRSLFLEHMKSCKKLPLVGVNAEFQQRCIQLNVSSSAILYHTKNRGGINVTNVTDSLYDKELEYMSHFLGKDNVLVVIDDLEDSGLEEKFTILAKQPSIIIHASDLVLISEKEKRDMESLLQKLLRIQLFTKPRGTSIFKPI
ncbi:Hypothetical predicted protein [Pelobates cultripes]|uniref:Uncharacterized protein n=1 Tax=Pelobates cultripes TaxID=61616 RepID=A0AAD1WJK1_PELCU|nr:Hypothetical predicted protein [Pelobates cultripes]